jgi:thiol:disulfide interchange protein DsbD
MRLPLILLALLLHLPAFAQSKTQTRLLLSAQTAKPGETVWAGLELKMAPHWHTYWRYCGDAGLPTTITWTLPAGVSAGEINWPLPKKTLLTAGDISLCTYVYEDRVVLLVPIKLDAGISAGSLNLRANLAWLECADKGGCVPGQSELTANLTVGHADKPSPDAALIAKWRARLPQTGPAPLATARWESIGPDNTRTVVIDWESAASPADFYPYEHQPSDVEGKTEPLPAPPGHLRLRKVVKKYEGQWPGQLVGLLVGRSNSRNPAAVEANLPLSNPTPPPEQAAGGK